MSCACTQFSTSMTTLIQLIGMDAMVTLPLCEVNIAVYSQNVANLTRIIVQHKLYGETHSPRSFVDESKHSNRL